MSKLRLEWKVGLFVFVGLVFLAGLLIQFSKGMTLFQPAHSIFLHAPNVGGLKTRASVLMSGVEVGKVGALALAPDGKSVTITLRIYSKFPIHKDARFVIEQSGFLGDQYVAILPTTNAGPVFINGGHAKAEAPFDLQEVARSAAGFIVRVDETVQRLNGMIADVHQHVLNQQTLTNFATAVSNLRLASERILTTVDNLNGLVTTNGPAIAQSASNLVVFSGQMNQFAGSLCGVVATNQTAVAAAVKNVESSTATLKGLLEDVQAGKGLVGTLIKNEPLAVEVSLVASNLSVTTSNLNRLGLWGVLWQHKPPKAPAATSRLSSPKNHLPSD